jgi:S-(hydroxymethyl)glutathione dehydrogenase / alcohol dehydrogenase
MKALVFHAPKDVRVETVPDPKIEEPRDIILRVTSTAICGSDLHIYNGFFPQVKPMVLGHEFMGIVEEAGPRVTRLKRGDRVVVPFPIACGHCWFCEHKLPTACEESNKKHYGPEGGVISQKGGGLFGYTDLYGGYSGGQAQYVRVPLAEYGPRKVPEALKDEEVLFLSDILPTGYTGLRWAEVRPGDTVAVWGCGPVGLMAQKMARVLGAKKVIGVDILDYRLQTARETAGSVTINAEKEDAIEAVRSMTDGRGADVVIEAVGMEAHRSLREKVSNVLHLQAGTISSLEQCISAARRGGRLSVLGVYGTTYANFPLGQLVDKGLRVQLGQAPVQTYIDELLAFIVEGRVKVDDIISHRLPLDQAARAYKVFCEKEDKCVKVVLNPWAA